MIVNITTHILITGMISNDEADILINRANNEQKPWSRSRFWRETRNSQIKRLYSKL